MSFNFDDDQLAIINSTDDNIVVVAGAGSGKTTVLTERIRKLLKDGVKPESIVAITFTKMAAEEMIERLSDTEGYDKMFIGTIHAFANELYKGSGVQFSILDDESEMYLMQDICKDSRVHIKYSVYTDFKSQRYDNGQVYEYITQKYGFSVMEELRHILEYPPNNKYPITVSLLAKIRNYITFDELIKRCTAYFEQTGNYVDYLFVDEFQDVGTLEYEFIKCLNARHNFVVGDDYQAIYGFKGATDKYFKFLVNNSKWKIYLLKNNYRCGSQIINYANTIINDNVIDYDEELKPAVCKSGFKGNIAKRNIRSIINKIKLDHKVNNIYYKDWFILCRTNKDINLVMDLLNDSEIPCNTFKKGSMNLADMKQLLNDDVVKVITIHSAKGLEADNVYVYWDNPEYGRYGSPNIEDFKLYYVACTRAKHNLFIL